MNYYTITEDIIKTNLDGNKLLVYAIICSMSQGGNSYHAGRSYLQKMTNCSSLKTIDNTLNYLVKNGFIIKKEIISNGVKFNAYYNAYKFNNEIDYSKFKNYILQDISSASRDLFINIDIVGDNVNIYIKLEKESAPDKWEFYINRQIEFWNGQHKTYYKANYTYKKGV